MVMIEHFYLFNISLFHKWIIHLLSPNFVPYVTVIFDWIRWFSSDPFSHKPHINPSLYMIRSVICHYDLIYLFFSNPVSPVTDSAFFFSFVSFTIASVFSRLIPLIYKWTQLFSFNLVSYMTLPVYSPHTLYYFFFLVFIFPSRLWMKLPFLVNHFVYEWILLCSSILHLWLKPSSVI